MAESVASAPESGSIATVEDSVAPLSVASAVTNRATVGSAVVVESSYSRTVAGAVIQEPPLLDEASQKMETASHRDSLFSLELKSCPVGDRCSVS